MTKPRRIQLSRRKGWRMPADTLKVDRSTPWGNPFPAPLPADRPAAVAAFAAHCRAPQQAAYRATARQQLRGRNLACWCPLDGPCHADVLLRIANGGRP